jgi:hypothetical protein
MLQTFVDSRFDLSAHLFDEIEQACDWLRERS